MSALRRGGSVNRHGGAGGACGAWSYCRLRRLRGASLQGGLDAGANHISIAVLAEVLCEGGCEVVVFACVFGIVEVFEVFAYIKIEGG